MFRELLSSRLVQAGVVFFVLCVGGSLLYHWHAQRTIETKMARHHARFLQALEKQNDTRPAQEVYVSIENETPGLVNTPEENTDTPISDETEALENDTDDIVDAFLPDDFVSEEEAPEENVPVSPYGFGPYPEIPAGYPSDWISGLTWLWSEEQVAQLEEVIQGSLEHRGVSFMEHMKTSELLGRLSIQLWVEGHDFDGITTLDETGLFYPNAPHVLYVKWSETKDSNGNVRRYISQSIGAAYSSLSFAERQGHEPPPDWIEIRSLSEGIDPYEYLGLNR